MPQVGPGDPTLDSFLASAGSALTGGPQQREPTSARSAGGEAPCGGWHFWGPCVEGPQKALKLRKHRRDSAL
eukprot:13980884-Alexandrium_andersonii.AAC.1